MKRPEIIQKPAILDLTNKAKVKSSIDSKETIEDCYTRLKAKRSSFETRAKRFSTYTIPYLYPDSDCEDSAPDGSNTTGWQSFGAQAVSTAQNKITMTLFPPHSSFARLELTPEAKRTLTKGDLDVIDAQGSLTEAEKQALMEHERIAGRVALGEAIKHLLVGGNACLYVPKEGNLICYPLQRYVTSRDKSGNVLELITEESKSLHTFDKGLQSLLENQLKAAGKYQKGKNVQLYTRAKLRDGMYIVDQEVSGIPVGKTYRISPENFPWIVLRWEANYGEHYGRSLVELHAGDFHVIQILSEAIAKGMILMADIKYLVRAGATTDVEHLISSPTGEFVTGNLDDIGVLQLEKYADFTPIASVLDKYERRVGQAFLMQSAVQRDAERVTTLEIRRDALEMEQLLAGAYSLLASTLQRPYFTLLLQRIGFDLPPKMANTVLMTGIEALGKMGEADKLQQFTEMMQLPATWPQPAVARVDWKKYMQYSANYLSYDLPFLKTEEQMQKDAEAAQAAQQNQAMQDAAVQAAPVMAQNVMNKGAV